MRRLFLSIPSTMILRLYIRLLLLIFIKGALDSQNSFDEVYRTWKKKWAASRTPLGPREVEGLVGEIAVFMQLMNTWMTLKN